MKKFRIKIDPKALTDIQNITDINEKMEFVEVLAVICTHRNPKLWEDKNGN